MAQQKKYHDVNEKNKKHITSKGIDRLSFIPPEDG
jgi:hypothetical protein